MRKWLLSQSATQLSSPLDAKGHEPGNELPGRASAMLTKAGHATAVCLTSRNPDAVAASSVKTAIARVDIVQWECGGFGAWVWNGGGKGAVTRTQVVRKQDLVPVLNNRPNHAEGITRKSNT